MEALNTVPCNFRILACPTECEASFRPLAKRVGFELVTGPKDDVLARFCNAIRRYGPDRIIRATGDNPFVFADAAAALAEESAALNADYAGYAGLPLGAGVEVLSAEALLRAEKEAEKPEEREHVCPYLYGHPELFCLHRPLAPLKWQNPRNRELRLTVDTPEDYQQAQKLYKALGEKLSEGESSPDRFGGISRYQGIAILEAAASC
jgi:spore coat polysaccharide biosynthesis protein SpsF